MAKRHKLAGNGIVLTSSLPLDDLQRICALVVGETKGDLLNGSYNMVLIEQRSDAMFYEMRNWVKLSHMSFVFRFSPTADGRTRVHTEILDYFTSQTTLYYFIPISPKKMVAHHSYSQLVNKLANTIRQADPAAPINIALGPYVELDADVRQPLGGTAAGGAVAAAPAIPPVPPAPPAAVEPRPVAQPTVPSPPVVAPTPVAAGPSPVPTMAEETVDRATPAAASSGDAEERTVHVARRPRTTQWLLHPEGLESLVVSDAVVLGREPHPGEPQLVAPDEEHTVSKRHAVVTVAPDGLTVTDLGSTNGTAVVGPTGESIECAPGVATPVPTGWWIELGTYPIRVESRRGART